MTSGVKFFLFLVTLPLICAIGADITLNIMFPERGIMLSTPGYILTQYWPEGFKEIVTMSGDTLWPWVNAALAQKSLAVGAGFAAFWYLVLAILKLGRFWPFKESHDAYGEPRPKRAKYKRK